MVRFTVTHDSPANIQLIFPDGVDIEFSGTLAKLVNLLGDYIPDYYTVIVPPGVTKWQSPRQDLSRGSFKCIKDAEKWAAEHVPGIRFNVVRIGERLAVAYALGNALAATTAFRVSHYPADKALQVERALGNGEFQGVPGIETSYGGESGSASEETARVELLGLMLTNPEILAACGG
jgi:hypothetical protein